MNFMRVLRSSSRRQEVTVVAVEMDSSQAQEPRRKPRRSQPKLERRNAAKNIDYSAVDVDYDELRSGGGGEGGAFRTKSLDIQTSASPASSRVFFASQTSFRIGGEEDGQFDMLCRNLGLTGPEDFAITPADWAAASKVFPNGDSDILVDVTGTETKDHPDSPTKENISPRQEAWEEEVVNPDVLSHSIFSKLRVTDVEPEQVKHHVFSPPTAVVGGGAGGGGIKGVRPLALAPPPSMSIPSVLDERSSTWDLMRSLAPDSVGVDDILSDQGMDDSSDSDGEDKVGIRIGETSKDIAGSCSTSNDDDSSSTTTEGMCTTSPNGKLKRNIGSWMKGRLLGSGSFGTVYEAISDCGFFFAVKEVSLLEQGNDAEQCICQLEQEISLLSTFEHENIVQYYGTEKEDTKLYIFLELITQGSLASLYHKYHLRDSQVSAYTRQILNGLKYLHERSVVHRDIKCANILVDANGSVKLADFGLAKETSKLSMLKSCKGSVYWMAPEVVNPRSTYGPSADIWSLGCTVLELLTRNIPFPSLEWTQALFLIGRGGQPTIPDTLSKDARDFIQQCVQVDPKKRPTAGQLLDHPFVKRPISNAWNSDSSTHGDRRT